MESELDKKFNEAEVIFANGNEIDSNANLKNTDKEVQAEYAKADKEWEKAVAIYKELGKANHLDALFRLGQCYCFGTGTGTGGKSDYPTAIKYLRKAAEQGHVLANETLRELKEMGKY